MRQLSYSPACDVRRNTYGNTHWDPTASIPEVADRFVDQRHLKPGLEVLPLIRRFGPCPFAPRHVSAFVPRIELRPPSCRLPVCSPFLQSMPAILDGDESNEEKCRERSGLEDCSRGYFVRDNRIFRRANEGGFTVELRVAGLHLFHVSHLVAFLTVYSTKLPTRCA